MRGCDWLLAGSPALPLVTFYWVKEDADFLPITSDMFHFSDNILTQSLGPCLIRLPSFSTSGHCIGDAIDGLICIFILRFWPSILNYTNGVNTYGFLHLYAPFHLGL